MAENKDSVKEIFNHIFGKRLDPTPKQLASLDRSKRIDNLRASIRTLHTALQDMSMELDALSWAECKSQMEQVQYCHKHNKQFVELFGNYDCEDCFVESHGVRNDN